MIDIQQADAYGVVLVNAKNEVMLREPSGHYGGYVWTYAKGRRNKNESPAETAIREAYEETGYRVELLDVIPGVFSGTTSSSAFYLAGPLGKQAKPTNETMATRWVGFEDAAELIAQTASKTGRDRDLAILDSARKVLGRLPWSRRPSVCGDDWRIKPLPRKRGEIVLDIAYDAGAMAGIFKGFLPTAMEEKWFAWFDGSVLHLHRSWTGFCIYQVNFANESGGWRAISAKVNRNPDQYSETDDNADRRMIAELIDDLLVNVRSENGVDPLSSALLLATQPNYLGSPDVVSSLIEKVIQISVAYTNGDTNFNAVWNLIWELSQSIAESDEYVRMPAWHTSDALGGALVKFMGVNAEALFADNLDYFVSEALAALFLQVRDLLRGFLKDPKAQWNPDALKQLNQLHQWAVQVFLGTNEIASPNTTLASFEWQPVDVGAS